MGERGIGLCARPDGLYDCYHSQWAASPAWLYPVLRGSGPGWLLDGPRWERRGTKPPGGAVATLDYLAIDAVYVVSAAGVGVALPVWLGIDIGQDSALQPDPSFGALVSVDTPWEVRALRTGTRQLKGRLGQRIDQGALAVTSAVDRLLAFLTRFRCWLSPAATPEVFRTPP